MVPQLFQLSDSERELLLLHHDFYLSLASGARRPKAEAQRHFVTVCRGEAQPVTEHETAFLHFKKLVALSRMTAKQMVQYRFSVQVALGEEVPEPKRREILPAPSADSQSDHSWREIDEFGEGVPRPGWFSDAGWRQMRAGYRFDSRD
jgi:hypothetical protein